MDANQLRRSPRTILITGATGFVGSHALEALQCRDGIKLIASCRDPARLSLRYSGEMRIGDLYREAHLARLFDGVDVLVNAAAWTSAWGHAKLSRRYFYEPTIRLLERAIASGVKRIVNISSTSVAAPDASADPMSRGIRRGRWPHLDNVVAIEDFLRERAGSSLTVVNLRLGIFAGQRYALGLLPILLPRLKTHLVPWVAGGRTSVPIVDGRDIGEAIALASLNEALTGYQSFNIVGPKVPTARQVITFLHDEFSYPKPHFGVPFPLAYLFGWLMEKLDPLVPWEPLVTRSIVHLLEEVNADNRRAEELLGYQPRFHWQEAVREQLAEMAVRQTRPMPLAKPLPHSYGR